MSKNQRLTLSAKTACLWKWPHAASKLTVWAKESPSGDKWHVQVMAKLKDGKRHTAFAYSKESVTKAAELAMEKLLANEA